MSALKYYIFNISVRIPNISSFCCRSFSDLCGSPAKPWEPAVSVHACGPVDRVVMKWHCEIWAVTGHCCFSHCQLSVVTVRQGEQNRDWSLANWIKALCALDWQTAVNTLGQQHWGMMCIQAHRYTKAHRLPVHCQLSVECGDLWVHCTIWRVLWSMSFQMHLQWLHTQFLLYREEWQSYIIHCKLFFMMESV